jgi:hypothetical protein
MVRGGPSGDIGRLAIFRSLIECSKGLAYLPECLDALADVLLHRPVETLALAIKEASLISEVSLVWAFGVTSVVMAAWAVSVVWAFRVISVVNI